MHRTTRLALPWVCVLAACAERGTPDTGTVAAASVSAHPGLVLLPEGPRAHVDREFRLTFHGGGSLAGPTIAVLRDTFDPFCARVGGHQLNVLAPDVALGRAGLGVRLPDDGNAMVGFSTVPRAVSWRGESVRFSQHVKTLFIASRTAGGVPVSSAAMSFRLGLRLEIVPMVDPLTLLPGEELPLQVRFEGPELGNVELVFERQITGPASEVFRGRTDDAGTVVVPIGKAGQYLATVTHDKREGGREVLWAALTFRIGEQR